MLFEVVKIITKIEIAKPIKIDEIVKTSMVNVLKLSNFKHPTIIQKTNGTTKLTITYFSFKVKKYRNHIIKGS